MNLSENGVLIPITEKNPLLRTDQLNDRTGQQGQNKDSVHISRVNSDVLSENLIIKQNNIKVPDTTQNLITKPVQQDDYKQYFYIKTKKKKLLVKIKFLKKIKNRIKIRYGHQALKFNNVGSYRYINVINELRQNHKGDAQYQLENYVTNKKNDKFYYSYPKYVIPQGHRIKMAWDMMVIVLLLWLSLFIPWSIAYPNDEIRPLDITILVIFIIDFSLAFRTTQTDDSGDEVIDANLIFKNYFKSKQFWIDLISAFPISEVYTGSDKRITRALSVLKIIRLVRLGRLIKLIKNTSLKLVSQIFQQVFIFIMIFHWITCIWILIVNSYYDPDDLTAINAWIPFTQRNLYQSAGYETNYNVVYQYYNNDSHAAQYIYAYYNMIMNVLGQDCFPINAVERVYLVFVQISGWIVLATIFGQTSLIIQLGLKYYLMKEKRQDELTIFLYVNDYPPELIETALRYFEYCWKRKKLLNLESKNFSELSKPLERQSIFHAFEQLIRSIPVFESLHTDYILMIARQMRSLVFMEGEEVLGEFHIINEVFIILEGQLENKIDIFDSDGEKKILKAGDHYGGEGLFREVRTRYGLFSISFSQIEAINKLFIKELYEKYEDFRSNIKREIKKIAWKKIKESNQGAFADMSEEDVNVIRKVSQDIFFEDKQTLFNKDGLVSGAYILMSGSIEISTIINQIYDREYEDFDEHQRWQYCYNYSKERLYYQKERTIEEFECFGQYNNKNKYVKKEISFFAIGLTYVIQIDENKLAHLNNIKPHLFENLTRFLNSRMKKVDENKYQNSTESPFRDNNAQKVKEKSLAEMYLDEIPANWLDDQYFLDLFNEKVNEINNIALKSQQIASKMAEEVPALIKKIEQKRALIIDEKENESDSDRETIKKPQFRRPEQRIRLNELKIPKIKALIDDSF